VGALTGRRFFSAVKKLCPSVSGTAKQHTSYDYAARIASGFSDGMAVSNDAFTALTQVSALFLTPVQICPRNPGVEMRFSTRQKPGGPSVAFSQCENANISVCTPAASLPYVITVYNPLPRAITETIRIPAPTDVSNIMVQDATGKFVPYDTISSPEFDQDQGGMPYTLVVTVNLPALGFNSYTVAPYFGDKEGVVARSLESESEWSESEDEKIKSADPNLTIANSMVSLTFDRSTGLLTTMSNLVTGVTVAVSQQWFWYNSTVCNSNWGYQGQYFQNSGAYVRWNGAFELICLFRVVLSYPTCCCQIFRPNTTEPYPVATSPVAIALTHNSVTVQEVTQVFAPWLNQARVCAC
jgi:alpha-mannosidase